MWETIFDDYSERLGSKLDIPMLANEIVRLTPNEGYREECRRFFDGKQHDLIVSMIMGITSQIDNSPKNLWVLPSDEDTVSIKGETGEWSAAVDGEWKDTFIDPTGVLGEQGVIDDKWWVPIKEWSFEGGIVNFPTSADPEIIEARDEEGKIVWKSRIKGEQWK